jgi:Uma2 family endonuclease
VRTGQNRRRVDRVIWAGLNRVPRKDEFPTILVDFTSYHKRDHLRDYEDRRNEYQASGVKEYWIVDRFQRIMTVFTMKAGKVVKRVIREHQVYTTPLLPGFELPLAELLAQADQWADVDDDDAG